MLLQAYSTKHLRTSKAWKSCRETYTHEKSVRRSLRRESPLSTARRRQVVPAAGSGKPQPTSTKAPMASPTSVPQPWDDFTLGMWAVRFTSHLGILLLFFWIAPRSTHMLTFSFREEWSFTHTMKIACEGCCKAPFLTPRPTRWEYGACLDLACSSSWIISLQSRCIKALSLPHKELPGLINWHRGIMRHCKML